MSTTRLARRGAAALAGAMTLILGAQPLPASASPQDLFGLLQRASAAWRLPERLSLPVLGVEGPQVALSPSGAAAVIWNRVIFRPHDGTFVVAATRSGPGGFGAAEVISGDGELAFGPQVTAAGESHVVVWLSSSGNRGRAAIVARTRRADGPWEPAEELAAIPVDPPTGITDPPRIAANGRGEAVVVWRDGNLGLRAVARTAAGGWEPPVTIATDAGERSPSVAIAPDGTAVAAWWARLGTRVVARAAFRPPGGQWAAPVTLSRSSEVEQPLLPAEPPNVSAGGGEGLVVWSQFIPPRRGTVHAARITASGRLGGRWRLALMPRVELGEGGLDQAGRATVLWSQLRGRASDLRWSTQVPGGPWTNPRVVPSSPTCQGLAQPRLAVAPVGDVVAIWAEYHARGDVILASARSPGGGFAPPEAISRAEASMPSLAVSDAGALAVWSREGDRERLSIEVAERFAGDGQMPAPVGLRPVPVPRMSGVRMPAAVGFREPLHIGLRLSRPARIEVHIVRVKPVRFLGPFRRSGQAGLNRITIPTWGVPGRRLGPGVYDVTLQALTAERESCPVTRRLVVRG